VQIDADTGPLRSCCSGFGTGFGMAFSGVVDKFNKVR